MATNIQKTPISPESSASAMLIISAAALLGALVVATIVWRGWTTTGVLLSVAGWTSVIIVAFVTVALATTSGIWVLRKINRLTGPIAVKCIVACLVDALALSILVAFVTVAYFLRFTD